MQIQSNSLSHLFQSLPALAVAAALAVPSAAAASTPEPLAEGPAAPPSVPVENTYPADHGRGMLVSGSVLVATGGAIMATGAGFMISGIRQERIANDNCDSDDSCGGGLALVALFGAALMVPGMLVAGGGVPLLVFGGKRRRARGHSRIRTARNWNLSPTKFQRGGGLSFAMRF